MICTAKQVCLLLFVKRPPDTNVTSPMHSFLVLIHVTNLVVRFNTVAGSEPWDRLPMGETRESRGRSMGMSNVLLKVSIQDVRFWDTFFWDPH